MVWPFKPSPKNPDEEVVEQLRKVGSKLSEPHGIDFFLYFPSEQTAGMVASRLLEEGFDAQVEMGADGSGWLCLAKKKLVPDVAVLTDIRHRFEALVAEFDGEYDGWGTEVVS